MVVQRYTADNKSKWDNFIDESKNGTFMLKRDYIEYHSDRFIDFSLMIYYEDKLVSVFPASVHGDCIISHGGLTYGGFITTKFMTVQCMLTLFQCVLAFFTQHNIKEIIYKRVPSIYHSFPSDEDLYALYRFNAVLCRRDISTSIYLPQKFDFSSRRKRNVKKAVNSKLSCRFSDDYQGYFRLLTDVLQKKYGVKPVHSASEIEYLVSCFPDNIKLFASFDSETMLAGTILFIDRGVVHTQYIANSEIGRKCGALDAVFDELINNIYSNMTYFDFGISTENDGLYLNEGLVTQKQEFGGRGIIYDFYKIKI